MRHNLGNLIQVRKLLGNVSVVATGNGTGLAVDDLEGQVALIADVSAPVAGTNPTMDLKLQHSDDDGSSDAYADVSGGAITQVTSAESQQKIVLQKGSLKKYVRIVKTIGGTSSPQYYVSAVLVGIKKYID